MGRHGPWHRFPGQQALPPVVQGNIGSPIGGPPSTAAAIDYKAGQQMGPLVHQQSQDEGNAQRWPAEELGGHSFKWHANHGNRGGMLPECAAQQSQQEPDRRNGAAQSPNLQERNAELHDDRSAEERGEPAEFGKGAGVQAASLALEIFRDSKEGDSLTITG